MGGRLRPANNSLVANDDLVEQRGGAYRQTYEQMGKVWSPAGIACQIQTDNPGNIVSQGDGSGTLEGTVCYAATVIGASSLELPVSYTEQVERLPAWAALFPDVAAPRFDPAPGPLGRRATRTPSDADPAYCRGRVQGEIFGDGHPGAGAWVFGGSPARRAEVARCLDVLGWAHAGGASSSEVAVPYSVLASGWGSLVPRRGAPTAEIQGWCGGVIEGVGSTAGLVWDLTVAFATGVALADKERCASDKTKWCVEQWRRLGADTAVLRSGEGEHTTWRAQLAAADHEIAQAIEHYVSWGRVPGGRP
jgi:hypothetical protein